MFSVQLYYYSDFLLALNKTRNNEHLLCAIVPPSGVVNDMNSEMVYQVWNQVK